MSYLYQIVLVLFAVGCVSKGTSESRKVASGAAEGKNVSCFLHGEKIIPLVEQQEGQLGVVLPSGTLSVRATAYPDHDYLLIHFYDKKMVGQFYATVELVRRLEVAVAGIGGKSRILVCVGRWGTIN